MDIRLTEQQQRALDSTDAQPLHVVDPRTNEAYVLIPLTEYEAVRELVDDDRRQRAIRTVALRNAGRRADEAP
jgi:hypothetical protein